MPSRSVGMFPGMHGDASHATRRTMDGSFGGRMDSFWLIAYLALLALAVAQSADDGTDRGEHMPKGWTEIRINGAPGTTECGGGEDGAVDGGDAGPDAEVARDADVAADAEAGADAELPPDADVPS